MSGEQAGQVDTGAAAFAAAFAETSGGLQPEAIYEAVAAGAADDAKQVDEDDKQQQAQQPEADKTPADPIEVLRQELHATQTQLGHQLRSAQGRIGALQRELNKARQQAQAQAPAQVEKPRMPAFERIKEELPDVAEAIAEHHSAFAQQHQQQVQVTQEGQDDETSRHEERLNKTFPDWAEKVSSTEFELWLTAQDPSYRETIKSTNDADDMLGALVAFERDTLRRQQPSPTANQAALVNQQRATRAAQAVDPTSRGTAARTPHGPTAESEFAKAFNKVLGNSG